jgi:hypothetical protein
MNTKLTKLAARKADLVGKAASQRAQLSQAMAPWRGPLAVVDRGIAAVRYVGSHPPLLAGVVGVAAFLVVRRPRRLVGWLQRGWMVWRVVLAVKQSLRGSGVPGPGKSTHT